MIAARYAPGTNAGTVADRPPSPPGRPRAGAAEHGAGPRSKPKCQGSQE